jgi:hypothetical protein
MYKHAQTELIERLNCKFKENSCQKLALLQFYFEEFSERVQTDSPSESDILNPRLQVTEQICFILSFLWSSQDPALQAYLTQHIPMPQVKQTLQLWLDSLEEEVSGVDLKQVLPALLLTLP